MKGIQMQTVRLFFRHAGSRPTIFGWLAAAALLCGAAGAVLATPRVLGPGSLDDAPAIRVLSSTPQGLEMEFELPALAIEDLSVGGETFQSLAIPFGGESGEVGQPMLPIFARLLQIPDRAGVQVQASVEQADEYDGIKVIPVQDEAGFAYDLDAYSRDTFGNTPPARVGGPALMHGLRVVPLTFAPVQFNAAQGKLRVARRIHVSVSFAGENLENAGRPDTRPIPASFDRIYRQMVINYDNGGRQVEEGTWLIICSNNTTLINSLQPLVTWRQRKGLKAVLANTAETGTSTSSIKAYIQEAYDTWDPPLEYVVLAGDASGTYSLPTWSYGGGEGDHPYTQLDGADPISDVHIGRLSFSSTPFPAAIDRIVSKIVNYESTPYLADDPGWFSRACLVGDPTTPSGLSPVQVMQSVKTQLRQVGYTQVDTVFNSPFVSQMSTYLNRGDTIFGYRGYYGMSGWSNSNTDALSNGWKMPFGVMSTCGTGSFQSGTAISEEFLRAWDTTNNRPRGAVGAIGTATTSTHTRFNNCYTMGVLAGLVFGGSYTMGEAHTLGKLDLYLNFWDAGLQNYVWEFCYWNNLMGDPACEVWTGYPADMTVTAPSGLSPGMNSVTVSVEDAGGPLAGAKVCLWKVNDTNGTTESYSVGPTDAGGAVELPVSLPTGGNLLLTVSKHNHRSYLASIPVTSQQHFVAYRSSVVDDDNTAPSRGNGDGQINPTETIELPVQVRNFGTQPVTGVSAVLTSADPYVTVISGASTFANLAPGDSAWTATPYVFSVDPGCPHGHVIRFALDVSAGSEQWHSLIDLPAVSAELQYVTLHWSNGGPNGLLDPGETVFVSIQLHNAGGLAATMPYVSVASLSDYVNFPVSARTYPTIAPGGNGENVLQPFTVHASSDCPNGYTAQVKLLLQFSGGIRDTVLVPLPVGTRGAADPTGPDAYGYLAYDNTDTAYPDHPTYDWVEVDPTQGGSGTEIVLGDNSDYQDKTRMVDLPFPFRYYGTTYTTASVCSNGWIQLGWTYLANYRNWTIPSYGGPNGIIAVFWDDLYQRSGSTPTAKCYQYYDTAGHKWIVEWQNFTNAYNHSSPETFEAIFYDPAYHTTATGDGMIDFQYRVFNNIDNIDEYATVGIEKPDNTDGLLYSYFNLYTAGSASITTGRAIRFVPTMEHLTAVDDSAPAFNLSLAVTNPDRPGSPVRFSLDRTGPASLRVYDVQGRLVRTLIDQPLAAGTHTASWDGRDGVGRFLPSGMYFYRLVSGERTVTGRGMLVR